MVDLLTISVEGPDGTERLWEAEDKIDTYNLSGPFAPINVPPRQSVTQAHRFNPPDLGRHADLLQCWCLSFDRYGRGSGRRRSDLDDPLFQILPDDLPYIEQTLMRWPLNVNLVEDREMLEPAKSYLRRW